MTHTMNKYDAQLVEEVSFMTVPCFYHKYDAQLVEEVSFMTVPCFYG
jgi:hypothetical protein